MTTETKYRAREIYKTDVKTFLIVAVAANLIDLALTNFSGTVLSLVASLVVSFVSAAAACFFFRAYNRGTPDITDCWYYFSSEFDMKKILSLILCMWLITSIPTVISIISLNPILMSIGVIFSVIVTLYFSILFYLYTANSSYPVGTYFKASFRYMHGHVWDYIFFCIVLYFAPAVIAAILSTMFGGSQTAIMICKAVVYTPFFPYINLALAGFMSYIIPDEWFAGTASFT